MINTRAGTRTQISPLGERRLVHQTTRAVEAWNTQSVQGSAGLRRSASRSQGQVMFTFAFIVISSLIQIRYSLAG